MTLPTKITVIGAGSASFGEDTLSAIMRSKKLQCFLLDPVITDIDVAKILDNYLTSYK
jgi:hypothetical protein